LELSRSDDRIIAGVCAGLAEEIGVEPMVFRTLYAATLVLFGLGVPLYVGLHLAMEPSAGEARPGSRSARPA
jgi:phage shock protein PspC (stress-responsive transcriptional regulator)